MSAPPSTTDPSAPTKRKGTRGSWNYHPEFPLPTSPLAWPLRPLVFIKDLLGGWLPMTVKLIIVGTSLLTWFYLSPSLEQTKNFELGWIAYIYFRNLIMLTVVAGGLHIYLYNIKGQGDNFRYESRGFEKDNSRFTFRNQVLDNIFWSLGTGVAIWTAYEVVGLWAYSNGLMPYLSWSENPVWFVLLFVFLPLWGSFHFYWIHRVIHWGPLYKWVHYLHHRNIVCGPWTGMSQHPVEQLGYLSSALIHIVMATHPVHFIYSLQFKILTGPTSHAGFERLTAGSEGKNGLRMGDFFHQLHHRYFECNYGDEMMPMDALFGSFHDGTPEAMKRIAGRMKEAGVNRA